MEFPSTEQMLNDLEGKLPADQHAMLVESGKYLARMEAAQLARLLQPVAGDADAVGKVRIPRPPRYTRLADRVGGG